MAQTPAAFRRHDHAACVAGAVERARALCEARGVRLTDTRRRVLEILLESHAAIGAYEVLRRLTTEGAGPQPPVAYRALDFLVANGLAHRIERLNAFVACDHPGAAHDATFLICRACGAVAEAPGEAVSRRLDEAADALGFAIDRRTVEVEGRCPRCRDAGPGAPTAAA
jgi:Fur family zinc uptake transcriptional regulator